jgi:cell division protein FtsB
MTRPPSAPPSADSDADLDPSGHREPAATEPPAPVVNGTPDLSAIPIAGLTRRRVAWLAGIAAVAWVMIAITRQAGDVAAITARADDSRSANAALTAEMQRLEAELELIQRPEFIAQQARAYRLGNPDEIPFSLADGAPPLPANAPGSPAVAVGVVVERPAPLEVWLDLLFGPDR